ncbi:hypothetical protein E2C01_098526 [Portunus trituberculatus]|uniref:Uncharacterized protein n=1 Tax=Portunus trituberculatus TaxID=210409 RepID=A0A5B7K8M1_PORTR|nr:hypothetical protein [Portunus trituberculatus]
MGNTTITTTTTISYKTLLIIITTTTTHMNTHLNHHHHHHHLHTLRYTTLPHPPFLCPFTHPSHMTQPAATPSAGSVTSPPPQPIYSTQGAADLGYDLWGASAKIHTALFLFSLLCASLIQKDLFKSTRFLFF